jgi:hypothetical protein
VIGLNPLLYFACASFTKKKVIYHGPKTGREAAKVSLDANDGKSNESYIKI